MAICGQGEVSMSECGKLKGGIIGCGYFGRIHLESWNRIPEVKIVAACDADLERAQGLAPCAYSSAVEMLAHEQLDFVDVATRAASHLPLVRLAAADKLPTICQKPMAPCWEDALSMVETARTAGIPLMIHDNWRWQPWYRAVKQLIDEGAIGQPLGYWFRTRHRYGIGPEPYPQQSYLRDIPRFLIDELLVHHLDTARYLFGDIAMVFAQARRINSTIVAEDQALIVAMHVSRLLGSIDGNRFVDPAPDGPALGEAGFEGDAGSIRVAATGDVFQGSLLVWENHVRDGYRGDSVRAAQQHFVTCLRTSEPFETEGREYLKTFAAVEAAYRSIAEGPAVSLSELMDMHS
jgi:predicted dehydrogenase